MNGYKIKLFMIALIFFVISDMIWLGLVAKNIYLEHYAPWLRLEDGQLKPLWWSALLVYLLFALSLVVFIIPLAQSSVFQAAMYGAVLGAIIYGVYDFTCLAIFKDFPISIGLIDWLWGMVLCSWCSAGTQYMSRYVGN